jgi:hypothetical protein
MDFLATKTNPELEDEEAERLVRPAPKDKPPRRDRRRERVETDRDSDKESDPDMSKNYKDVGGAVLLRWAKKKNIPVRNRSTGEVVPGGVSPKTLKKDPGKYEVMEGEEAQAKAPKKRKPKAPEQPKVEQLSVGQTQSALQELAKGNEALASDMKYIVDTTIPGGVGQTAKHSPHMALSDRYKGLKLPPGVETLGDLQKVLLAKPEPEPEGGAEAPPKAQPEGEETPAKAPPEAPPGEEAPEKPKSKKKKSKPKPSKEVSVPESTPEEDAKDDKALAAEVVQRWTKNRRHKRPAFQQFLDEMPTGDLDPMSGEVLVLDPKTRKRVPFDRLDTKAQKALIDEFSERREKDGVKKTKDRNSLKQGKQAVESLATWDPEVRETLEALSDPNSEASQKVAKLAKGHDLKDIRVEKVFPELRGKLPEDLASVDVAQQIVKSASEYEALSESAKTGVGEPKRREASESEMEQSLTYLMDNLPPDVATSLFERGIHPDDARDLVDHYKTAQQQPVKDPVAYAQSISEIYTDDPDRVKPPKKFNGKLFQHLSNEDKAEALRQQQMKVLAMSLAAKDALAKSLTKSTGLLGGSVPPVLASTLANSMLMQKSGASEKAKAEQATKMAAIVFDSMMSEGQHIPVSDRAVKGLMKKVDPHTQEVAKAFFQANDYHAAKDKFLGGEEGLSEHESTRSILKGLRKANTFMEEKAALYGGGNVAHTLFRTRVLDKLRTLAPEKHQIVQARLDKDDSDAYDQVHKKWAAEHKAWLARKEAFDQDQKPSGGPYRAKPKDEFREPKPIEPIKPVRYGAHRKPGGKKKVDALWESVFGRDKTASRVATRHAHLISTYPCGKAMGQRSDKTAVYHGIEPDQVDPYPDWQQAHQRDLGEADFAAIMEAARKWLKTPVLSKHVDGMLPDQQFRAALDYAIQTGIYNRAINPTLYDMLLARLAGWPEPGPEQTLLTLRGSTCEAPTSRRPDMAAKTAEQSKYASNILGRFDKLAQDVQAHHEAWGMTMAEAKEVVNHLDVVADDFEKAAFGEGSFQNRQREVLAAVIQHDSDEPYMKTFEKPFQPHQTDADEPYMSAYDDDDSSGVEKGKEENGEPLAP